MGFFSKLFKGPEIDMEMWSLFYRKRHKTQLMQLL